MPTFDFTSPDGKSYSVQGPDGATPAQAFQILQQHLGAATTAPAAPEASPVSVNDVGRAAATGVPIIGGLLNKADAATNAALAPILNPLFDAKDQLPEATFGERYAHSLKDQEGADNRFASEHPIVDTAAQLAGGAAALAPVAGTAAGARALGLTGETLAGRAAAGAASGAAIGGADAGVRGENPVSGAATGALVGGAAPVVGQVAGKAVEGIRDLISPKSAEIPTTEAIKDAATNGYNALRDMDVRVKPEAVQGLAQKMQQDFHGDGFRDYLAPKTAGVLDELAQPAPEGSFATFSDLHGIRRALGKAAQSIDPTEKAAASRAISTLDDYLGNVPASDVISGDADAAAKLLKEANANYSTAKASELLQGKIDAAELQAASSHSGANLDNALRQRIKDIIKSPKLRQGYKPEELIQMQQVVRGTAPGNVVRAVGNLLGGGGGLGALLSAGAGALAEGPIGIVTPLAGMAVKKIGNRMTEAQLARLDEMIRARAPTSAQARAVKEALAEARQRRLAASQARGSLGGRAASPTVNGALLDDRRNERRQK